MNDRRVLAATVMVLALAAMTACGASGGGSDAGPTTSSRGAGDGPTTSTTPAGRPRLTLPQRPDGSSLTLPPRDQSTTTPDSPAKTTLPPLPTPGEDPVAACGPPDGEWAVTTYTTARFEINICQSLTGGEVWYRGRNLESGDRIDLPAEIADRGVYAENGKVSYYVSGDALEVYEGDEQILREPVISVR